MTSQTVQLQPAGLSMYGILNVDIAFSFSFPSGTDLSGSTFSWIVPDAANSPYAGTVASETVSFVIPKADVDSLPRGSIRHYVIQNDGSKDIALMMGDIILID